MKSSIAITAAVVATFAAGASEVYLSINPLATKDLTALQADEGVPHNLVTALKADEGVPHNLVTALKADEERRTISSPH